MARGEFFPGTSLDDRAREVRRRVSRGSHDAVFQAMQDIVGGVIDASDQANSHTARKLTDFAEALGEFGTATQRLTAHQQLGEGMHRAVLASFQAAKRQFRPAVYQPRPNRETHGALESALRRPSNIFRATPSGILYINEAGLSAEAKQWARLNFGAGSRGRGSLGEYEVRFSNMVVATIGLNEEARPAFGMPAGYFLSNEGELQYFDGSRRGEDAFYQQGTGPQSRISARTKVRQRGGEITKSGGYISQRGRMRPTKGITGYNFLDAGMANLADNIGPVYRRLFNDIVDGALRRGRPFGVTVTGTAGFRRSGAPRRY